MSSMKCSSAKKASITLPSDLEEELQRLARSENRTLSGVIQEASRYYLNVRKFERLQQTVMLKAAERGIFDEHDLQEVIESYRRKK